MDDIYNILSQMNHEIIQKQQIFSQFNDLQYLKDYPVNV